MLQDLKDADEIIFHVTVSTEKLWVPVETAARSIWVDYEWFTLRGGSIIPNEGMAEAVNGHNLNVKGVVLLNFELWGQKFSEEVRVLQNLPDKLLIGRKFWRRHSLRLDLAANCGSIRIHSTWVSGRISRGQSFANSEKVRKVLEGADVDRNLRYEADYTEFSSEPSMQMKLRHLLWTKREIFKGLGRIKGVKHEIYLKQDARPICQPLRKRSPG